MLKADEKAAAVLQADEHAAAMLQANGGATTVLKATEKVSAVTATMVAAQEATSRETDAHLTARVVKEADEHIEWIRVRHMRACGESMESLEV